MVVLEAFFSVSGNKRNEYDGHLAWSSVPSTKQAKPNHIEREERDIGIEDADRNAIFLFVDQLGQLVNKEKEEIKYGMFQSILVWSLCPSNIREIFDCHGRLHSKALFHLSQIALLMLSSSVLFQLWNFIQVLSVEKFSSFHSLGNFLSRLL